MKFNKGISPSSVEESHNAIALYRSMFFLELMMSLKSWFLKTRKEKFTNVF